MRMAKCPICGCEEFYVKDPDDEFEIYDFKCKDGKIFFDEEIDKEKIPDIKDEIETYCNRCKWHDKLEKLKQ